MINGSPFRPLLLAAALLCGSPPARADVVMDWNDVAFKLER